MATQPHPAKRFLSWIPDLARPGGARPRAPDRARARGPARVTHAHERGSPGAAPPGGPTDVMHEVVRAQVAPAATAPRATPPVPIVAFAKDWHEDPTSNHHVLRELAKTRRVLWLNSLATRTPKLTSSARPREDLAASSREFARGPVNVENDLWVAHAARAAAAAQRRPRARSTAGCCGRRSARCGGGSASTRSSCGRSCRPPATTSARSARSSSIYYCVDEWSMFALPRSRSRPSPPSARCSRGSMPCSRSTTRSPKRSAHATPRPTSSPHGVDHALFARALDDRRRGCPPTSPRCQARGSASTARCATGSTSS